MLPTSRGLLVALLFVSAVFSFKPEDFKKCNDASFCRRQRATPSESSFSVSSVQHAGSKVTGEIADSNDAEKPLVFEATTYSNGVVRLKITEKNPLKRRYEVQDSLVEDLPKLETTAVFEDSPTEIVIRASAGADAAQKLRITKAPFKAVLEVDGQPAIILNQRGMLRLERVIESEDKAPPV